MRKIQGCAQHHDHLSNRMQSNSSLVTVLVEAWVCVVIHLNCILLRCHMLLDNRQKQD